MKLIVIYLIAATALVTGCKKGIEVVAPPTSTNAANVYTNDATAAAVLTGIYASISANGYLSTPGLNSISLFTGLSADEIALKSGTSSTVYNAYYTNNLASNTAGFEFWNSTYPIIYDANSAIEGLTASKSLTPAIKTQLLGEAKFVRAFCYFYLANLYGDVPLALTTGATVNSKLSRSSKSDVLKQVIADLSDAQSQLSTNYLDADAATVTTERIRPTKWAATALLARTYLYTGDWANAETQATAVISNNTLYDTVRLASSASNVFQKNSKEAIWQLQPVLSGQNTQDARTFVLPASGPTTSTFPFYLNSSLVNSFEAGDMRKSSWVGSVIVGPDTFYYANKYKVFAANAAVTEYLMVLRLGEQYLIRAEARAQKNDLANAQADLNVIRKRARLVATTASTQSALLTAIQQERRVELYTEWGHRWLDLKRTNSVDAVMSVVTPQKGGTWQSTDALYPLPLLDIQRDQNLVQNPGY